MLVELAHKNTEKWNKQNGSLSDLYFCLLFLSDSPAGLSRQCFLESGRKRPSAMCSNQSYLLSCFGSNNWYHRLLPMSNFLSYGHVGSIRRPHHTKDHLVAGLLAAHLYCLSWWNWRASALGLIPVHTNWRRASGPLDCCPTNILYKKPPVGPKMKMHIYEKCTGYWACIRT